jgi:hypothetical protein
MEEISNISEIFFSASTSSNNLSLNQSKISEKIELVWQKKLIETNE